MKPIAPKVTKIEALENMKIRIEWDGKSKVVDISDSDLPDRFPKLKDMGYFKQAHLHGGSISWKDGLHLDLDELVYDWPDVGEVDKLKSTGLLKVLAKMIKG